MILPLFREKCSDNFLRFILHRVKYCGNWDVLRPAKIVEGMGLISENLLEKLNNEAHSMIEKMGCAV